MRVHVGVGWVWALVRSVCLSQRGDAFARVLRASRASHVHAFAFVLEGIELSAVRAEGGWLEVQKRYSRRALK